MGFRRYVDEVFETRVALVFSLVLRTENNSLTHGGGYCILRKPLPDAVLEKALDDAVQAIVRLGDKALPRDKARIRAEALAEGLENTGLGNVLRELVRGKNLTDWPTLGRGRT